MLLLFHFTLHCVDKLKCEKYLNCKVFWVSRCVKTICCTCIPLRVTEREPSEHTFPRVHKDKTRQFKSLPGSCKEKKNKGKLGKVYVTAGFGTRDWWKMIWMGRRPVSCWRCTKLPVWWGSTAVFSLIFYGHTAVGGSWWDISDVVCV